ncbi:MAG: AGE family epimerase/isomerase [Rhizomicrobium sp.]|jgi:mannose-6-phosphate isomerase
MKNGRGYDAFRRERDALTAWLFDDALPLWWRVDADRVSGGFFEQIGQDGKPIDGIRRVRVPARQIYSFAVSRDLGWNGPFEAVEHGLNFLVTKCYGSNGCFLSNVTPEGRPVGREFDLYDNAFGLFGLAFGFAARTERVLLATLADTIRDKLITGWAHPLGGFEEAEPRMLPLRANPHMHLLEAALAWIEIDPASEAWNSLADELAELCLAKFLHPANGCVREFFDGDWNPAPGEMGHIAEPGHQFEWGWLLTRWGRMRARDDALAAAKKLVMLGERHGVDPVRGVAFNLIRDDLSPMDKAARLWPQTERIKGWLAAASLADTADEIDQAFAKVADASAVLRRYFETPIRGLWRDKMDEEGRFVEEPAPASSLYHIVCAISELHAVVA